MLAKIRQLLSACGFTNTDSVYTDPKRWLVLDCESTGLNPRKDYLLAISAIGITKTKDCGLEINYDDFFEVYVRPPSEVVKESQNSNKKKLDSARENVMVHGIGLGTQREGKTAKEAIVEFNNFLQLGDVTDKSGVGLIGYHSGFDELLLNSTAKACGIPILPYPWLDLDPALAELHKEHRRCPLDYWLDYYKIICPKRHDATADTLATAELLLQSWFEFSAQGVIDWQTLKRKASDGRRNIHH